MQRMTDSPVNEAGPAPSFKLWRPSHAHSVEMYRGVDALDATPRYLVQDYILAATERGMCATTYRGARTLLGPGLLQVVQPGEVMTCTPLEPMTFRALECSEELPRSVGEDVFQRHVPVPHFQAHAVPDRVLEARFMALHLCRCAAYPQIRAAVLDAAQREGV